MGGYVFHPAGLGDGTDGGLVVSSGFFKAVEIVGPEKKLRRFVHSVEIERRVSVVEGKTLCERVFLPVQEIGVFTGDGVEPGVKIRLRRNNLMNPDGRWQDGIYFVAKIGSAYGGVALRVEVRHVADGVDTGVGPARSGDGDFLSEKRRKRLFESLLHARSALLDLPSGERGAAI